MADFLKRHDCDLAVVYVSMQDLGKTPEYVAFRGEWAGASDFGGMDYGGGGAYEKRVYGTDDRESYFALPAWPVPSCIDFRIWCADQMIKRCGMTGIYEDNAYLAP